MGGYTHAHMHTQAETTASIEALDAKVKDLTLALDQKTIEFEDKSNAFNASQASLAALEKKFQDISIKLRTTEEDYEASSSECAQLAKGRFMRTC